MADFFRKASIDDRKEELFSLAIKSIEKNANIMQLLVIKYFISNFKNLSVFYSKLFSFFSE